MARCWQMEPNEQRQWMLETCPAQAEVPCAYCHKELCRDHAHIFDNEHAACPNCLSNLGAPV